MAKPGQSHIGAQRPNHHHFINSQLTHQTHSQGRRVGQNRVQDLSTAVQTHPSSKHRADKTHSCGAAKHHHFHISLPHHLAGDDDLVLRANPAVGQVAGPNLKLSEVALQLCNVKSPASSGVKPAWRHKQRRIVLAFMYSPWAGHSVPPRTLLLALALHGLRQKAEEPNNQKSSPDAARAYTSLATTVSGNGTASRADARAHLQVILICWPQTSMDQ